jgi:hypothetical protein
MRWIETQIVRAGKPAEESFAPDWTRALDPAWAVLYWLRSRYDGLRYGRDRDARSW